MSQSESDRSREELIRRVSRSLEAGQPTNPVKVPASQAIRRRDFLGRVAGGIGFALVFSGITRAMGAACRDYTYSYTTTSVIGAGTQTSTRTVTTNVSDGSGTGTSSGVISRAFSHAEGHQVSTVGFTMNGTVTYTSSASGGTVTVTRSYPSAPDETRTVTVTVSVTEPFEAKQGEKTELVAAMANEDHLWDFVAVDDPGSRHPRKKLDLPI